MCADVSVSDTTGRSEGMTRGFGESMARPDKVKTSVEHRPRRCKETRIYEPQFWVSVPKWALDYVIQRTSMLEPGKNSKSVSALSISP